MLIKKNHITFHIDQFKRNTKWLSSFLNWEKVHNIQKLNNYLYSFATYAHTLHNTINIYKVLSPFSEYN